MKWKEWLICFGSFLIQFTVFGVHNNFGLIFYNLVKEFKHSATETAWIGSLSMALTFFVGPISQILTSRIGFKILILMSMVCCTGGLLISSFVDNIHLLPITYSVLWGSGSGFANHAALVAIQQNFDKKLSIANGIASSGSGFGTLILGPYLNYFLQNFGFRWALRALIPFLVLFVFAIAFNRSQYDGSTEIVTKNDDTDNSNNMKEIDHKQLLLGQLNGHSHVYHQHKEPNEHSHVHYPHKELNRHSHVHYPQKEVIMTENLIVDSIEKKSILAEVFDKEIWFNGKYVIFVFGVSIFLSGMFMPFIFLVQHASSKGISINKAQFLIGILAIVSTIVKISSGFILDHQNFLSRSTFFILSMYGMSLSHLVSAFSNSYFMFCLYAVLFGIFEGCFVGQLAAVVVDIIPCKSKIGLALGNLFAILSIPVMIGPIISGKFSSGTAYSIPFFIACGFNLFGAIITTLIKLFNSKVTDVKIETSSCGVTKVQTIQDTLLIGSRESLIVSNTHSVTFTALTRSDSYRQNRSARNNLQENGRT